MLSTVGFRRFLDPVETLVELLEEALETSRVLVESLVVIRQNVFLGTELAVQCIKIRDWLQKINETDDLVLVRWLVVVAENVPRGLPDEIQVRVISLLHLILVLLILHDLLDDVRPGESLLLRPVRQTDDKFNRLLRDIISELVLETVHETRNSLRVIFSSTQKIEFAERTVSELRGTLGISLALRLLNTDSEEFMEWKTASLQYK